MFIPFGKFGLELFNFVHFVKALLQKHLVLDWELLDLSKLVVDAFIFELFQNLFVCGSLWSLGIPKDFINYSNVILANFVIGKAWATCGYVWHLETLCDTFQFLYGLFSIGGTKPLLQRFFVSDLEILQLLLFLQFLFECFRNLSLSFFLNLLLHFVFKLLFELLLHRSNSLIFILDSLEKIMKFLLLLDSFFV